MTDTTIALAAGSALRGRPRGRRTSRRRDSRFGPVIVAPYVILTILFGILPALYAIYLAFTDANGAFAPAANFAKVIGDYRFWPATLHVALYLLIWLVALLVLVVFLAITIHSVAIRWVNSSFRLLFYLPGALAGASSVMLWLFVLDPGASPVGWLLHAMGFSSFHDVIQPDGLPLIFAIIAFWTGAGGWIVVMYGALNNIPVEIMEAARIDGADRVQVAFRIQIPLLRKWIAYMGVLSLGAGTQLFVEPSLLSQASNAVVPNDYSLNQLAYQYAFDLNDFNGSAAISVLLLVVALILSAVFVLRGGLFDTEDA
ncbi:carbohydrate ABC transporter permease [Leifsonia shinshuensis]|uniref:Multiple sugar transport system permease protein n=1 Tax=Leifsonia shinshuensis TaxID=150026 RepID=A0A853CVB6_9MICO|nr:sugar ABC transporter permease [Leifsonia shinshuensis]NYJ22760.1 multiple sugar transport system permease protein [Leifsonia shinshuensis]